MRIPSPRSPPQAICADSGIDLFCRPPPAPFDTARIGKPVLTVRGTGSETAYEKSSSTSTGSSGTTSAIAGVANGSGTRTCPPQRGQVNCCPHKCDWARNRAPHRHATSIAGLGVAAAWGRGIVSGCEQPGQFTVFPARLALAAKRLPQRHDTIIAMTRSPGTPRRGKPETQPSQTCAYHAHKSRTKTPNNSLMPAGHARVDIAEDIIQSRRLQSTNSSVSCSATRQHSASRRPAPIALAVPRCPPTWRNRASPGRGATARRETVCRRS